MAGRPPKKDSRDKQYRVRLNDVEDEMLSFCSEETGEAKSEIFRKALKAYYENTKFFKNVLNDREKPLEFDYSDAMQYDVHEDYGMDHISLKRAIACPYCGSENNMDFEEDYNCFEEEGQMGPQIEYTFDLTDCECRKCGKHFRVSGSIWEYPIGAYNYEDIDVEAYNEENEDE